MFIPVKVVEKVQENKDVFTVKTDFSIKPLPGQFAMIWLPGIDEFPMSFSYVDDHPGFTFKVLGNGTKKLSEMNEGDRIFIRGPFGNGYREYGENALFIAGGTGIASLAPFIEKSKFKKKTILIGFKNKNDVFFLERLKKYGDVSIFTEDGSLGKKGLVTDGINIENIDSVYVCGPEKMLRKIIDLLGDKNVSIQASLERYMKCGIGICDSCSINGFRVCVDGPVFSKEDLLKMPDLGIFNRLPSGKKIKE